MVSSRGTGTRRSSSGNRRARLNESTGFRIFDAQVGAQVLAPTSNEPGVEAIDLDEVVLVRSSTDGVLESETETVQVVRSGVPDELSLSLEPRDVVPPKR